MPQSPRESRHSRRDEDESRHRSSHHEGGSRHHRDRRSLSPVRSPRRRSTERNTKTSPGLGDREWKRHRSPHRHRRSPSRVKEQGHADVKLPFAARLLTKADLPTFEPLFADYLSLQKQKNIEEMDEREIKGRWKSFVGKWNRGELAEGWYDPEMFQRIQARDPAPKRKFGDEASPADEDRPPGRSNSNGSDEEDYGPVLPGAAPRGRRAGVGIPTRQDLALRNELAEESREEEREALRAARKADRASQKERLEELVPRAEPGTRERKLEKRQEANEKMRQFREKSPGMEVGDKDLMGGGDSLDEYKRAKEREQRRKSEREVRREEIERARREEIEEKRRAWQQREDQTVSMLKELARQRFG